MAKTNIIQTEINIPLEETAVLSSPLPEKYDVAVIGGGLAGLALSVQLARKGHSVIVFEKENYPFHKVCGEYISLESWDFLVSLGVDLGMMGLPIIKKLQLSALNGRLFERKLPLGGFGISRYLLDDELAKIARNSGVQVQENVKVNDVIMTSDSFHIKTTRGDYYAEIACGTYGKRSNLDIRRKRAFVLAPKNRLNNYIGVKYHVRINFPTDTIALHNFRKGYCGLSKVESDKYCLCYLTTADNLHKSGGSITEMERTILSKNPRIKKILTESERMFEPPVTISQISFDKKEQVQDHLLMIGDAAGMITPLCGNGMSMALHGSKLAAKTIHRFLEGKISRKVMEETYSREWQKQFGRRLRAGRMVQRLFISPGLANAVIRVIRPFPRLIDLLIRQTHGKKF